MSEFDFNGMLEDILIPICVVRLTLPIEATGGTLSPELQDLVAQNVVKARRVFRYHTLPIPGSECRIAQKKTMVPLLLGPSLSFRVRDALASGIVDPHLLSQIAPAVRGVDGSFDTNYMVIEKITQAPPK
jgi:hypothetical protein